MTIIPYCHYYEFKTMPMELASLGRAHHPLPHPKHIHKFIFKDNVVSGQGFIKFTFPVRSGNVIVGAKRRREKKTARERRKILRF